MIYHNELIFLIYTMGIATAMLAALRLSKEALVSMIVLLWVFANFLVTKQITLFGLNATASDALAIGATLGLNLTQEFYGKAAARSAIWAGFLGLVLYTVMAYLHCAYVPSSCDITHGLFTSLLASAPRITAASFIAYLISQNLEYYLYGFMQRVLHGRHFIFRNYTSVAITQLIDTILFSLLGLYGIVDHIGQIILISYCIKLLTLVIMTPMLSLARRVISRTQP